MKIVVASGSAVKIRAVEQGFRRMFPTKHQIEVTGYAVPSGVPDQPMGDAETKCGAYNRVRNVALLQPQADLFVAIEGGCAIEKDCLGREHMIGFAWVVLMDKHDVWGEARSVCFQLPDVVADLIRGGKELGEADDIVFGKNNTKQDAGALGLLTQGVIMREELYVMPVVAALVPVKNSILFLEGKLA